MIDETTTLADVAGAVASVLRELHYDPVVVGGSAATLHAPNAYLSADVDMVVIGGIRENRSVITKLATIGFELRNGMFFHAKSAYTIEFVPSPVAIANDVISEFETFETAFGPLRALRATDVVNDRLNKYVAYEDPESLETAVAVARAKNVDPTLVEAFILRQSDDPVYGPSYRAAFERFRRRLGAVPERVMSSFGFITTFRIRFRVSPTPESADSIVRRVQSLLDEERSQIDPILDAISIGTSVQTDDSDRTLLSATLDVRTKRGQALVDRFTLATAIVDHLRTRLDAFPELIDVPDDGTPPVAITGF